MSPHHGTLFAFLSSSLRIQKTEIEPVIDIQPVQECAERRHIVSIETRYAFRRRLPQFGLFRIPHDLVLSDVEFTNIVTLHRSVYNGRNRAKIFTDNSCV